LRRLLVLAALTACGGAGSGVATPALPPPKPPAVAFPDDPRPLPRYHSKRLALSVPLPDGHSWRIDDHTRPELVATHAPTRSTVVVAVFRTDELVGRRECEDLARDRKLVPPEGMRTLEAEVGVTQQTFDTRTVVAVEPGAAPDQPLVGHVMAFGGFLRKCFVFHFSTHVDGAADEPVLSARLAYARARILGGLALETLGSVRRETPQGDEQAPR
jgi:hypothetical protein